MKERLKRIRLTLNYTQQEMAEKLNIPIRTYRTYEYVSKGYPVELIQNLIRLLDVNANYLFTGIGEMFIKNKFYTVEKQGNYVIKNIYKFGDRISEFQAKTNLSDNDFAKILGLYTNEYLELKACKREPNLSILNALKQNFRVSVDWLLYGE